MRNIILSSILSLFLGVCIVLGIAKIRHNEEAPQADKENECFVFSLSPKAKFWDAAEEVANSLNEQGCDRQFVLINGVSFSLPPFSFYEKRGRGLYMGNDENQVEFYLKEGFSYNYKKIAENQGDYAKVFVGDEVLLHEVTLLRYILHEHAVDADFLRKEEGSGIKIRISKQPIKQE
ncbi:MAG: hypothetical protein JJT75_08570 [Opitutales bacterium]|nr:hypothetical protein [Opitutales bacterium]MCH8539356.1 hypothetical protein [Opitutales bacterium]